MKDSLRKWKLLIVALAVVAGVTIFANMNKAHALEDIPPPVVEYYEEAVWAVTSFNTGGSAFHISPTFLITNRHVAEKLEDDGAQATIWRPGSLIDHGVEVVAISEVYDLAILYCATCIDMNPPLLTIQDRHFPVGAATYGGGFGYGLFAIHAGYIGSFNWWTWNVTTDTIAQPGDSGSPQIVLNSDGTLSLVGVRTWGLDRMVFLVPAGGVAGFLRRHELL